MLTHPTYDRLLALGLTGMAKALEEQRRQRNVVGTDPVKVRLVSSLAGPGSNITGVTNVELITKCFELMRSLMPPGATIAVLVNQGNTPQAAIEKRTIQDLAHVLGGVRIPVLEAISGLFSHDLFMIE